MFPIVLGTKPKASKGHSAILLDQDRVLVIKGNTSSDDCFWFLEVGFSSHFLSVQSIVILVLNIGSVFLICR